MKQKRYLSNCVSSLKQIQAQLHNDLNPSVAARLDRVVRQLESCLEHEVHDPLLLRAVRSEALKTLALVIESVVGIADIIAHLCK